MDGSGIAFTETSNGIAMGEFMEHDRVYSQRSGSVFFYRRISISIETQLINLVQLFF